MHYQAVAMLGNSGTVLTVSLHLLGLASSLAVASQMQGTHHVSTKSEISEGQDKQWNK